MAGQTPIRPDDHLLSPDNVALVVNEYQPEQVDIVGSIGHDEIKLNITTVARAAAAYDLPVVLSTISVEMGTNSGTSTSSGTSATVRRPDRSPISLSTG